MKGLETLHIDAWEAAASEAIQKKAVKALEEGKVIYLPRLPFHLHKKELHFLTPDIVDPKSKNISFDIRTESLKGAKCAGSDQEELSSLLKRFARSSRHLIDSLFPHYTPFINQARTSLRTVEIAGRVSSYRKDDTRLHVDAFPATPVKDQRILRVFTNVNPEGKPRVWRIGEPFTNVVDQFMPKIRRPIPGIASLMQILKLTKGYRTPYDHYMLKMHDAMKGDLHYQKGAPQEEIQFPPGSTWIVYSDLVSHAAMSGQHMFEQTFYLPVHGMQDEKRAPLRVLEGYLGRQLL